MNSNTNYKIAVIGNGPAGIASIGQLLSHNISPILWIDSSFTGGRLQHYQKVPSNTKVSIFEGFINECPVFTQFTSLEGAENPLSHYSGMDKDKGCSLKYAYDQLLTLTNNIKKYYGDKVDFVTGFVESLTKEGNTWNLDIKNQNQESLKFEAKGVILATGSQPRVFPKGKSIAELYGYRDQNNCLLPQEIDLDESLDSEILKNKVNHEDTVAIIGSSHSSMVVIKNLIQLGINSPKKIYCLYIQPLKFAEYMEEGWILNDNTGLKGEVADWVRNQLMKGLVPNVEMIYMKNHEEQKKIFTEYIKNCSKIIYTIGFSRNPLPKIYKKQELELVQVIDESITYNKKTSEIQTVCDGNKVNLEGLYGFGIAWPEEVQDPRGNVELAVGLFKFIKFTQRVVPEIIEKQINKEI